MSFMAGFADGYIGAREKRVERETAEADDMFKLTYKSFLDRKAERQTQSEKDRKAAATAQAIAQRYNQPLAPVLDALRAGTDESIVIDMAKSGGWAPVEGDGPEEDPMATDLEASEPAQVDPTVPPEGATVVGPAFDDPGRNAAFTQSVGKIAQIEGRSPDEVAAELNPVQASTSGPGGAYAYTARPEQKEFDPAVIQQQDMEMRQRVARGEISQADYEGWAAQNIAPAVAAESMFDVAPELQLPTSPEGMDVFLANARLSNDPEKIKLAEETLRIREARMLEEARAAGKFGTATKAIFTRPDGTRDVGMIVQDQDGTFRNVSNPGSPPIDPNTIIEYDEEIQTLDKTLIEQSQSKPVLDYKNNLIQVTSGIRIAGDLMDMVDTNPEVLANVSSGLALTVNNVGKELAAFGSLFEAADRGESFALNEGQVRQLENTVAGIDPNAIQDRAAQYALFKAKTLLYIYRMGAAEGQEGRALTEADVQRLETMLGASTDVESYKENLLEYTQSQIDILNDKSRGLSQYNVPLDQYKKFSGGYNPYGTPAPTPEQFIMESGDPQLQETYKKLKDAPITNPSPEYLERQRNKAQTRGQGLPGEGIPDGPEFDRFYESLEPGSAFIGPDGKKYTKPIEEVQ